MADSLVLLPMNNHAGPAPTILLDIALGGFGPLPRCLSLAFAAPLFGEVMLGTSGTAEIDQESISRSQTLADKEDSAVFGFKRFAESSWRSP